MLTGPRVCDEQTNLCIELRYAQLIKMSLALTTRFNRYCGEDVNGSFSQPGSWIS